MKVVITGGGGFLGNQLARALAKRGKVTGVSGAEEDIDTILLCDLAIGEAARTGFEGGRFSVEFATGDVADRDFVFSLVDRDDVSVFHLASVISGDGERDFDLAMRVNLDGGRHLLEACRARASTPRFLFASSVAAFGGPDMPQVVGDLTKRQPETTYGMTKVVGELMINDYTRRGFLDGRTLRLPTIYIRPGKPNAAASSFASGLFREPLNGELCELPVSRDQLVPLLGYRSVVRAFVDLHEIDGERIGSDRTLGLPSLSHTVGELIGVLETVAGKHGISLGEIVDKPDPMIQNIVAGWPTATDGGRAEALGIKGDESVEEVVEAYLEDFWRKAD